VAAVSKQGFTTLFVLFYTSPGYHTTNHQVWGDQYLNINMIKERIFDQNDHDSLQKATNEQIKTGLRPSEM
jgi:hypothetical protein